MPAIKGCIYYVSGGASGLGLATVKALLVKGALIALLDINEEAGQALEKENDSICFSQCDVRDEKSIAKAIERTEKKWPKALTVGCLNMGGVGYSEPFVKKDGKPFDLEAFKTVVDINLTGSFNLSRLVTSRIVLQYEQPKKPASMAEMIKMEPFPTAVPGAVNEDRGIIIFTSSAASTDGQDGQTAYSASKAGLVGMTLPMARDLARYGIRVVGIAPSAFDTAMGSAIPNKAKANLLAGSVFPPRSGHADEFAHLALAIVENAFINGTTIRLDGAVRMNKL